MEEKKKKMSSLDATLMGIGEIIGAGIFSMTGVAIVVAGPGTPITYLLAGLCAMILCLPVYEYFFCNTCKRWTVSVCISIY